MLRNSRAIIPVAAGVSPSRLPERTCGVRPVGDILCDLIRRLDNQTGRAG